MKPLSYSRGYTLVEILVVIGIVAILAAIIFPAIGRYRQAARQTMCSSNLRQLAMAVAQYVHDNDDLLPPYNSHFSGPWITPGGSVPVTDHGADLVACLNPYIHNKDIWFCPADIYARTPSKVGFVNHLYTSYANGIAWWKPLGKTIALGHTSIDDPGPVNVQKSPMHGFVLFTDDLWPYFSVPGPPYSHNGRFNAVMFDGHVKSIIALDKPVAEP